MIIEDLFERGPRYNYKELPFGEPFVGYDNVDESVFFVKLETGGSLFFSKHKAWPGFEYDSSFNLNTPYRICTPKRVTINWKG
jgi:hypothetical protein